MKKSTLMKKYTLSIFTIVLCITMIPIVSFGVSKPSRVTIKSAIVDEYDNVTVTWNKVKCDGYKVEGGWYFHDDPAEPDYYEPKTSKTIAKSKTAGTIKAKRSDWADYVVRVRAFNKYKQKQYYNTKTHYWTTKKPSKKNWKGRKTRKKTAYKYGSYEWVEPTFEMSKDDIDIDSLDSPEGLSKELQIQWYSKKFTEKLYNKVLNKTFVATDSIPGKAEACNILMSTPNFYELSDAMKIFALSESGYFSQSKKEGLWSMHYDKNYKGCASDLSQLQMMKNLYNGTARGVCHDYALYEIAYLKSLGIKANYQSNSTHAWIIITVKNALGEILTIKFDSAISNNDVEYIYYN